jgi:hypothetical protein
VVSFSLYVMMEWQLIQRFEGGRSSYEEHSVEKQFGSKSLILPPNLFSQEVNVEEY